MFLTLRSIVDFVFPTVTPFSEEERKGIAERSQEALAAIAECDWSRDTQAALDQALRIADAEAQRRTTAETKATTYLSVTAALVPIVLTIQGSSWAKEAGPAPEWLRLVVLTIAVGYTGMAGWYAFATLNVASFHRVGVPEVVDAWKADKPLPELVKNTLAATARSQATVNAKVTMIKMTHLHLIRAFIVFVVLLLMDPAFEGLGWVAENWRLSAFACAKSGG